ncbi:sulfocyanin-like copper-binding protein [Alicyclobacillus kakegawensis]|uniref:sulfocyanin-like copper-binding protein n=1 Tax=Alicyclobacillus kakegawensis TaxID=392012 RepID=UPI0008358375|nr:sulfocyanin-like copper-binding protein [Alicyclobacillus kakegawensis]
MKVSPIGMLVIAVGVLVAVACWVVGYFGLPNEVTHRNLAENPKLAVSVTNGKASATQTSAAGASTSGAASKPLAQLDKAAKTVDLNITTNQDMAFNGYAKGALKISVPTGWTVKVTFSNSSTIQHSVGFTDWAHRQGSSFPAAFSHSLMPGFQSGITSSHAPVSFQFTADKAGKYAMVCGIPGHAAMGMWDELDVSNHLQTPTVTTDKGTQKVS